MERITDFLFEVGMLKKTPRTGFQFLGSGQESVAEHIAQTVFIGYTLCQLEAGVDVARVMMLCLFHDLPEARTGDMNYMNKKYVTVDEEKAVQDLTEGLSFGGDIQGAITEFNARQTREARVARDADQLALLLQLKEHGDLGNKYSEEWIGYTIRRLHTESAKQLAAAMVTTDWSHWWFKDKSDWWVKGNSD